MTNEKLLNSLSELVKKERELVTEILKYLLMVESRKLYLVLGYSSMFKFCVDYLKRKLARIFPEIQTQAIEKTKVMADEKTLVQFVAGPELMAKIEKLKGLPISL